MSSTLIDMHTYHFYQALLPSIPCRYTVFKMWHAQLFLFYSVILTAARPVVAAIAHNRLAYLLPY